MYEFEHRFEYDGKAGIAEARWNSLSERYELRAINITSPEAARITPYSDATLLESVNDLSKQIIADIRKTDPCAFQRGCVAAYDERQRQARRQKRTKFDPRREYGTYDVRSL